MNSRKRGLPYEIWSEIFQYTNKRQCREFEMDYEWNAIHKEYLNWCELYKWKYVQGDLLKLEFMKNAATLIEKNNNGIKRIELKKDIKEICPPVDPMDRINYNRVYVQCSNVKTGCDICKKMGKMTKCTECYREAHLECFDFVECVGCEKIHCKWCHFRCVDCSGLYCGKMINMNCNSSTYEYVCTLCGIHCNLCGKHYAYKDSMICGICQNRTCGCRECKSCKVVLCESSRSCQVCEEPICDDCDTGLLRYAGLCDSCEHLTWNCEECGTTNTTVICTGCYSLTLSPSPSSSSDSESDSTESSL